jgi:hypothetical protein
MDVPLRIGERFALFKHNRLGDVRHVFPDKMLQPSVSVLTRSGVDALEDDLLPAKYTCCRPSFESLRSRCNSLFEFGISCLGYFVDECLGGLSLRGSLASVTHWVQDINPLFCFALHELTTDIIFDPSTMGGHTLPSRGEFICCLLCQWTVALGYGLGCCRCRCRRSPKCKRYTS